MPPRVLKFACLLAIAVCIAMPAMAEDIFTVSGIHVAATAASSTEALNLAIAQGRPRAWQVLYHRLTRERDWDRQPALDASTLVRISRGYTPGNERRSTTRYVADVTYIFNREAVSRVLRDANIPFTQTSVRQILLVPMSPNFADGPWAQALSAPSLRGGVVPYIVPAAAENPGLVGLNFNTASWSNVAAAAGRIKANEAALVQAVYANGKVTVNIRRLGQGEAPTKTSLEVPLLQTLSTTYPAAAQAAIAAMEDLWKAHLVVNFNTRGTLTADVQVDSLNQWGQIQSALAGVDNITNVQVIAMDLGYARLSIAYLGTPDQLRDALNDQGLGLTNRAGQWMISPGGR